MQMSIEVGAQATEASPTAVGRKAPVCLITGASSGLGKATALRFATLGYTVVMTARDPVRVGKARAEVVAAATSGEIVLLPADLSSLREVRALAADFRTRFSRLDVLVANAGVYRARLEITDDGLEMTMAVNHVAHFLLTHLLLDPLREAGGCIVVVSSASHGAARLTRAPIEDILYGRGRYNGMRAYADSKLANILFTFAFARRSEGAGVRINALHPGSLATRIWYQNRDPASLFMRLLTPFLRRPARGATAVVQLATEPRLAEVSGAYFDGLKEKQAARVAYDETLQAALWEATVEAAGME